MAGGKFSEANLFGMTIRESANDGSDFTNPDADYRRLFLGEDGLLHLRDSAGTVTTPAQGGYTPGGTDVAVADGGTGASSASAARTNLGLVLGTDVASLTAGVVPIAQLATGTPTGSKFIRDDGTLQVPAGGGGGTTPTLLLDFTLASNVGPITLTAANWIEIIANQTFTVASGTSLVEIIIRGLGINNAGAGNYVATRIQIDSAGTPINKQLGGIFRISTNENIFEGIAPVYVSGLSAAAHTVKVQAFANGGDSFFCRPVSTAPEFFGMQVIEHL